MGAKFPVGSIQFEVGIQTFNEEWPHESRVAKKNEKIDENLLLRKKHGFISTPISLSAPEKTSTLLPSLIV